MKSNIVLALVAALFGASAKLTFAMPVCERAGCALGRFPAGALLSVYTVDGREHGMVTCTATLIAPDVVLTAAHCTVNFFDGLFSARHYFTLATDVSRFGKASIVLPPSTFGVMALVPHPDFAGVGRPLSAGLTRLNDIAVGFLDRPVCDVAPAVVADTRNTALLVTGSPVTTAGYDESGHVHYSEGEIGQIAESEIQIRRVQATRLKCYGDSGGPTYDIVERDHLQRRVVIGVTSRSYDHSGCSGAAIDTRLNAYLDWIEGTLFSGCAEGIRHSVCGIIGSGIQE